MTPLRDVQTWMVSAITGAPVDASSPERFVTAGPRMTAEERLDVYRRGYRARLVECLADDYPILKELLGEEGFEAVGVAYVDRHPSSSPNLNAFGRHMSRFLLESPVVGGATSPAFASELAALEWALVLAVHAAGTPPLKLDELGSLAPEAWAATRLARGDSVQLLRFAHPVNAFFQSAKEGALPRAIPDAAPSAVVVYRRDALVWRMDLTPAMARVLGPLLDGEPLGEALVALERHGDAAEIAEAEAGLSAWFRDWTAAGLFAGFMRA